MNKLQFEKSSGSHRQTASQYKKETPVGFVGAIWRWKLYEKAYFYKDHFKLVSQT